VRIAKRSGERIAPELRPQGEEVKDMRDISEFMGVIAS
jgi:hypothetical protein